MKRLKQRLSALAVVGALLGGGLVTVAAVPASAAEGVVVVQSKSDAPKETVWTPGVPNPETCMVTDTGVLTVPGQRHEAETELRAPYKQVIPGQTELTHQEYKYSRTVADYKTQYFFAKFTHTKTRTWIEGTPATPGVWANFSPNDYQGTFQGPPSYPTDPRGTWHDKGKLPPGQAGPDGVYSNGNPDKGGNWFYRKAGTPGTPGSWSAWSDYGPWTLWTPIQHTSWQDSNAPIGSPEFHGQGDTFYREWQQRPTGETRQVPNGSHVENTDWLTAPPAGEGWTQVDVRTVKDREATADKTVYFLPGGEPTTTLTDANYTATNPGTPWVKAGDDKRFETKAAYSDPDVVTNYSHTHQAEDCVVPPGPANPTAIATAVCDAVDVVLTNPLIKDANQKTASFVVFVDGEYYEAYAVEAGNREAFTVKGAHKVEVFQAGTSEWKLIASAEAKTDCVVPPTEPPVTPPATETPKPTPAPVATPESGNLAQTGGDAGPFLTLAGIGALVAAAGAVLIRKRRQA